MAHLDRAFRRRRALPAAVALALALALALAMPGCVAEPDDIGTLSQIGVVEGRVLEVGQPVATTIVFRDRLDDALTVRASAAVDSTGWYRVALPIGQYGIEFDTDINYLYSSGIVDTITVGRTVRRKDFSLGRIAISVKVPAEFAGTRSRIDVYRPEFRTESSMTIADSVATFDMRLMPFGAYLMKMRLGDPGEYFFLPGSSFVAEADSLHVGADHQVYEVDLRPRFARISGQVTGSWQGGANPMAVLAYNDYFGHVATTSCEPDGTFRLDLLGGMRLRFVASCGNVDQWFGGNSFQTATVYDIARGEHLDGLALEEGGMRVLFEGPGLVVNNSTALDLTGPDGLRRSVYGNGLRQVLISNLPAGDYLLHVRGVCNGDPWRAQWYDDATEEEDARPVTVSLSTFTDVTFRLRAGGVIAGKVTGYPYDGNTYSYVRITNAQGEPVCSGSRYAPVGVFRFAGLDDGDYCLSLDLPGNDWWYPGTFDFALAEPLSITNAGTVENLIWPLPVTSAKVSP